jgi:predicted nucleic acid-binding protein
LLIIRNGGRAADVLQLLQRRSFHVGIDAEAEAAALESLMRRYEDAPMSLADACLVRLSEIHSDCRILTLDAHFKRYRRHGRHVIPLLAPW